MTLLNDRLKYEMHNSSLIPDLVPAPIFEQVPNVCISGVQSWGSDFNPLLFLTFSMPD